MRKAILIFLIAAGNVSAQDMIITKSGDTLNCSITKEEEFYIHFYYIDGGKLKKTAISTADVRLSEKDRFRNYPIMPKKHRYTKRDYPQWWLIAGGGITYRTGSIDPDLPESAKSHIEQLKRGYHVVGNVSFFLCENIGIGVTWSRNFARNSGNIIVYDPYAKKHFKFLLDETVTIQFIGPSLCWRMMSVNKYNELISIFSIGYTSYLDQVTSPGHLTLEGGSGSVRYCVGANFGTAKIGGHLSVSLASGLIDEFTVTDANGTSRRKLPRGTYESLQHFNFTAGIRFNLN